MSKNNNYYDDSRDADSKYVHSPEIQERLTSKYKFNASFEKRIEYLWFQSRRLGWSYNDFVIHLLDILIVLQLRDKIKAARLKTKV